MSFERIESKIDKLGEKIEKSLIEQAKVSTTLNGHIKDHCYLKKQERETTILQEERLDNFDRHATKVKFVAKYVLLPITSAILIGLTKLLFF